MRTRITKYGGRNWAVWIGDELLAVTVYKKGARAVAELVEGLSAGTTAAYRMAEADAGNRSHEQRGSVATLHPVQLQGAA